MQTNTFVHAHCHSEYSLLDGLMRIEEWVPRAAELGYEALCLTDHGNMYGAVEFYETCREHAIQPILGMEAYMAPGAMTERDPKLHPYHLILLAANETGFRNLMQLSSRGFLEGFYRRPRIDKQALREHSEGLIALTACLKGEVQWLLHTGQHEEAFAAAREYRDIFGPERFFIEVQRTGMAAQDAIIPLQLKLAEELGLTPLATNDAHYLAPEAAKHQDVMMCIQMNKKLSDQDRLKMSTDQMFFKSPAAMAEAFGGMERLLTNTHRLAALVDFELQLDQPHFPRFTVPGGVSEAAYLQQLARAGLERRLPGCGSRYHERLNYELEIIDRMGFNAYFLIVQDFVNFAKQADIPVGPGRGSAASSLVAYATGITDLDPIEHGLIFERFLNPERKSMPDVDIDFAPERRHEVIKYVEDKYGHDRVCQIVTFNRMKARAAIRDAGRVLDIPLPTVDRLAKLVPWGPKVTLDDALKQVAELRDARKEPVIDDLIRTAQGIEGLARNAGVHPAGLLIAPGPLNEYVPLATREGELVAQWDMVGVEKAGLVKMDFLGLKTLSYIRHTLDLVKQHRGLALDLAAIATNDPATFELLGRGEMLGIFQLEGGGMRQLLMDMQPDKLGDLIACIALYRPGPLNSGLHERYVRRKHGTEPITYAHPVMEPILGETYGVLTYQEQIAQLFVDMAGMRLGQAVQVIKIISKKRSKAEIEVYREQFVEGAATLHGVTKSLSSQLFDQILEFAGYGFNKAHSCAYGLVAYQTAYLKANYPAEFYAAYLTSEMENHDKLALIVAEMKERGLALLPPAVSASAATFTLQPDAEGHTAIRFGLAGIKGVGARVAEGIAAEALARPYRDLGDLCARLDARIANKLVIEALIGAGACDGLPGHRAQQLAAVDSALEASKSQQEDVARGQFALFGDSAVAAAPAFHLPTVPEWPETELLAKERALTGLFLTRHPVEELWEALKPLITPIGTLTVEDDKRKLRLAGMVCGFQRKLSKKLAPYAIFTLEDVTGSLEVLVFPQSFEKAREVLTEDALVVCAGRLAVEERDAQGEEATERSGRLKFLCDDVLLAREVLSNGMHVPEMPPERAHDIEVHEAFAGAPTLLLEIELTNGKVAEFCQQLSDVLTEHSGGETTVHLVLSNGEQALRRDLGMRVEDASAAAKALRAHWPSLEWSVG